MTHLPDPWQLYPMPPEQVSAIQRHISHRVARAAIEAVQEDRERILDLLAQAAVGRREYAASLSGNDRASSEVIDDMALILEDEARQLETVARLVRGDLTAMTAWLPSWRWTDEMTEEKR